MRYIFQSMENKKWLKSNYKQKIQLTKFVKLNAEFDKLIFNFNHLNRRNYIEPQYKYRYNSVWFPLPILNHMF